MPYYSTCNRIYPYTCNNQKETQMNWNYDNNGWFIRYEKLSEEIIRHILTYFSSQFRNAQYH